MARVTTRMSQNGNYSPGAGRDALVFSDAQALGILLPCGWV